MAKEGIDKLYKKSVSSPTCLPAYGGIGDDTGFTVRTLVTEWSLFIKFIIDENL